MDEANEQQKPVRTLKQHLWQGAVYAHKRRPVSFYMLLSIPVVLVLAANLFRATDDPRQLAFGLSILFVFLGVILIRAFLDISALTRAHLAERRQTYKETLGDEAFLETLRERQAQPGTARERTRERDA